ncbi:putative Guanosine-3',5'-bis(diphosphate) 3'-diphosphatase [Candidatus Promineifilum breve]|uniref:Guanosine-3',5'-bis(Diphosphate) 3'-diphosphatase n=1 Tax=Candidatus Promineifilum breve TaxID=1806508 RepID=A0A160T6I6_9CHLR|nr:TGS domain-containing protein [Candidatus Promineifilum breve]CUS05624.1 putative Guanosine-3',5'-bis(diphosphate) 3'-diphosphatase [Candidatus Promineifilum breve]
MTTTSGSANRSLAGMAATDADVKTHLAGESLPAGWPDHISHLATEWRLPAESVAAACLVAGVPCAGLVGRPPPNVVELAVKLLEWQRYYLPAGLPTATPQDAPPAAERRLREFYRAICCDAPDMRHVLMLLAAHHLRLFGPDAGPALAAETLGVYAPMAGMLGMYHVRRCWIEESVRLTRGDEYRQQAAAMGIVLDEPTSEALESAVDRQQAAWPPAASGSPLPPNRDLLDLEQRAILFSRLRHDLDTALRHEFGPDNKPEVQLIFDLPGHALQRREQAIGTMDNPQLIVRVVCHSRVDCYRAMDVIHNVGRLAGTGQTQVIRDYIAAPHPNGYRALQTYTIWPQPSEFTSDGRLIKFHILTAEMQHLNEWGILAGMDQDPAPRRRIAAWWNHLDEKSRSLSSRTKDKYGDIAAYLHHFPPGSAADPLYCFTPLGEIVLLKPGRTALDFAYRIHSQLGPQTAKVFINGESVPLGTPLQNGDMVNVIYDPLVAHIDFSWQDLVGSKRSCRKIRAALQRRAGFTHPGRGEFERALIRRLDLYKRRSPDQPYSPPACTSSEIDRFLERAALGYGAAGREALYADLAGRPQLADELANRLITESNVRNLRLPNGEPLPTHLKRIEQCPSCRPTVKDAIHGRLFGAAGEMLIIHIPSCRRGSPNAPIMELQWDTEDLAESWPLYHFEINTRDFDGLLNKMLQLVYGIPHAYLYSIEARVNELYRAIIKLDVAIKLPQLCQDLQAQIVALADDTQVSYRALLGNRRGEVSAVDMSRQINNPFTTSEVTDWRFMGRDEVINSILSWINGYPVRSQVLLLHGQRRVGKSSLVSRLCEQGKLKEGERPVVPVRVDFRNAKLDQPHTVAELLIQNIFYNAIGQPPPRLELHEDPLIWLDRHLHEAERLLAGKRLLLLIDEFDAGYESFVAAKRRPRLLGQLRAMMDAHAGIRWLLVVQDVYLADPLLQAALPHLPLEVPRVHVGHLPPEAARQLIIDLTVRNEYRFAPAAPGEDGIPEQIVQWTAGNPYFIHIIGHRLLSRVAREKTRLIRPHDLTLTIQLILGRPIFFSHFIEPFEASPARRRIVYHLAHTLKLGERRPLDEMTPTLAALCDIPAGAVAAHLDYMAQVGVLDVARDHRQGDMVGIPVRIWHEWLANYWAAEPDNPAGGG